MTSHVDLKRYFGVCVCVLLGHHRFKTETDHHHCRLLPAGLWFSFLNETMVCWRLFVPEWRPEQFYCKSHTRHLYWPPNYATSLAADIRRVAHYSVVSYHRQLDCVYNGLFGLTPKKITGSTLLALCMWNPPVTDGFPTQKASNAERVAVPWRRHDQMLIIAELYTESWWRYLLCAPPFLFAERRLFSLNIIRSVCFQWWTNYPLWSEARGCLYITFAWQYSYVICCDFLLCIAHPRLKSSQMPLCIALQNKIRFVPTLPHDHTMAPWWSLTSICL